jgi:ribosome-binding factor A
MSKSGYSRSSRVADQIRIEVADILLRKTKDPRVASVTVTDVEVTSDLRLARIYVTTMQQPGDDPRHEIDALAGLDKAVGFIRAELGRRLHLRYTPELSFHKDTAGPRADRVLTILDRLQSESGGDGTPA